MATEKVAASPSWAVEVSGGLRLAAAPTFALMAVISAVGSPGMPICSAVSGFVPIDGMALMYALMSLFHLSPWTTLIGARLQPITTPLTQTEGD